MADIDNKIYEVDNRKNSYFIHLDDLAYLFYKGDLVLKTLYGNLKIKFNEKYKDEPLDVLIPNEGLVINTAHYSKDELKDLLYNVLKEKYSHF